MATLEAEGVRFGSMADFHNSSEARHKLYEVNRATALDEPGSDGTFMFRDGAAGPDNRLQQPEK